MIHARIPFRHGIHQAKSLAVKRRVYTTDYLRLINVAILINDKLHDNTSLNTILLCGSRIPQVL